MHAQLEVAILDRPTSDEFLLGDVSQLRVHMIGIGGSGMSGAAALLRSLGATVSGSDVAPFDGLGSLVSMGVRISIGHHESQLDGRTQLVVVSAAIPESNPELAAARRCNTPVMKYAQLVGALTTLRKTIAVAGTHGKSTTTGMCVHLLRAAGLDPSFIIGARSSELGGSSGVGSGPHFVVESCEFDRSFHHLRPRSAAILNIEPDHMDCYASLEEIVEAFGEFAAKVASDGLVVCNGDDPRSSEAARAGCARVETFGFSEGADWRAVDLHGDRGRFSFDVLRNGRRFLSTRLAIPGRHNVANALAATALAFDAGAPADAIAEALRSFHGVDRRLMWKGEARGITIVDDYAHHPTEIRVTITAARARYNPQRLWVVFQPHQDSRTRYFMDQFATSFGEADEVIMPDVYLARDKVDASARPGSLELASRISDGGGKARYIPALGAVVERLISEVAEGDLVLTMGAGDVWKVADELVERICGSGRVRCAPGAADVVSSGGTRSVSVPAA